MPNPTEWWLRPVIRAARVGEHSAAEWNWVCAMRSIAGVAAAAKRSRNAAALIIGHDEQSVGRALRRHHTSSPIRLRLAGLEVDFAAELRRRWGKIFSINRRR